MRSKIVLIFFIILPIICAFPDDRIVFRDDDDEIDDSANDLKYDNARLLSDKNILKSDNNSFIADTQALRDLENGNFFQGDIVLQPDQQEILEMVLKDEDFPTRTGIISEEYRWPKNRNGKVVIPFEISEDYCE
jgi:hypothetical protein